MKKPGKVLSMVLSVAFVVSSFPMTFANAASAEDPAEGAKLTLTQADLALAVDPAASTHTDAVTLTNPSDITYTAKDGKQYTATVVAADVTWTSSNPEVAKVGGTAATPTVTPLKKGDATLTCTVKPKKLTYAAGVTGSEATITIGASATVAVKVYNKDAIILADKTQPADFADGGVIPTATTSFAMNATPAYVAYKVGVAAGKATFTAYTGVTEGTGDDVVVKSTVSYKTQFDKIKLTSASGTAGENAEAGTEAKVDAATNKAAPYIGSDVVIAQETTTETKTVKAIASLPISTVKEFDVGATAAAATLDVDPSYNATKTVSDGYDVTGLKVVGTAATVTIKGNVGNVDVTGNVKVEGGTTGNITATGDVTVESALSKNAKVGNIDAGGSVSVTGTNKDTTAVAGTIASDSTVTVNGANATVGNVRAKDDITVEAGATTGSLTGVVTPTNVAGAAMTVSYPEVAITDGATVNGDIIGNKVALAGKAADTTPGSEADAIPVLVKGNVTVKKNTTTSGTAGTATIGDSSKEADVTVTGSVIDADGGATLAVAQAKKAATDSTPAKVGVTTVGGLVGFKPAADAKATTIVTFTNYEGAISALNNFGSVKVDATSDVKVSAPLVIDAVSTATALDVDGTLELPQGATVSGLIGGTGTLKMPAGKLTAKDGFATGAALKFDSTTPVKVNDVIFKANGNVAADPNDTVKVEGVTLASKLTGNNAYDYYAKSVKITGIALDNDKLEVPATTSAIITASTTPMGQSLPDGYTLKWVVTDGKNVELLNDTGMTATVKATDYDPLNANDVNVATVAAYVVDKDGSIVVDYPQVTCTVTATKAPELSKVALTADTDEVTVDAPATLTVSAVEPANATLPEGASNYAWSVDDDAFTVTPAADGKSATVSIAEAPEEDKTATVTVKVGNLTATATVTAAKKEETPNFTFDSFPTKM